MFLTQCRNEIIEIFETYQLFNMLLYHCRNYYVHRTRREEAFDSSAVLTPAYDLTQYKLVYFFEGKQLKLCLLIFKN